MQEGGLFGASSFLDLHQPTVRDFIDVQLQTASGSQPTQLQLSG